MPNSSDGAPQIQQPPAKRGLRERLSTPSWVLYDFSDTIFSASILTLYFPVWVAKDAGGSEILFTIALSVSGLLVALTSPMFGAISDRMNRRMPLLAVCVSLCVLCTALIGRFGGLQTGIALFILANFLYQTGLIFYNSLIVNISSEKTRGIVSGIGYGAGYVGLFVAFMIMSGIVERGGNQAAFLPTAVLYLIFSLPLLLIVKEAGVSGSLDIKGAYTQIYRTFQRARQHVNLFRFIIARLMYMEAINTVTSFYVLYLINIGDFTQDEATGMIIRVLFVAAAASVAAGFLVSKIGSKKVLIVGLVGWTIVVAVASVLTAQWMFWAIAVVMGFFWAAPEIADRVLLTRLAPQGQVGEFFGLFRMSGRLSAVVGPALLGLTLKLLESYGDISFRVGLVVMALFLIAGLAIMFWVREEREESDLAPNEAA